MLHFRIYKIYLLRIEKKIYSSNDICNHLCNDIERQYNTRSTYIIRGAHTNDNERQRSFIIKTLQRTELKTLYDKYTVCLSYNVFNLH